MTAENLRRMALKLPHATEDVKWGQDLCFCIGGKMFCVTGMDQDPVSASLKVPDDDFEEMCERPGIVPAPYVARYKWVLIQDISKIKVKEMEQLVRKSYELVFNGLTKKIQKELNSKN